MRVVLTPPTDVLLSIQFETGSGINLNRFGTADQVTISEDGREKFSITSSEV